MTSQHTEQSRQQCIETLRDMIHDIEIAMLTTIAENGQVRSRPMQTPPHEFDGDLWFFTLGTDPKAAEISAHANVGVTYSSPHNHCYVALSGTAELVQDRKKIELTWHDDLLEWFPAGPADPDLLLIRVRVNEAEYWHFKGKRFGRIRSLVSRQPTSEHSHERLEW